MFLKFEIDDTDVESYTAVFNYEPVIDGKPNPEIISDFFTRKLFDHIKSTVKVGRGLLSPEPPITKQP